MSSKLRPPGSKLKEPAKPRGDGEGSSRPPSRGGTSQSISPSLSDASTTRRPSMSRENSQSRLPVFKRESSMPQISRDTASASATPNIRREKSEIKPPKKTATPATPRGSTKPIITESTPKTVAERKVADRNIAAKGTRSGISGVSDKIIIGDKVLISASNKIGMVQYIGETKFAKGIWAGVVLEDATGKNDGSVSGTRYFSCPPSRGVFVKEEKLEKVTNLNTTTTPSRTPRTNTTINRNESALSMDSGVEEEQDLNVGDQVYITSANATRLGFLRYIGLTEFAKGTWCGVELHEPTGKNDGAVAGTRYFQCEPKYGIFAQIHKVKKYCSSSAIDSSFSSTGPLSPPILKIEHADTSRPNQTEEEMTLNAPEAVLQDEVASHGENTSSVPIVPNDCREAEVSVKGNDNSTTEQENLKDILRKSSSTEKMIHDNEYNTIRLQGMVASLEKGKVALESEIRESKHKIEDLQFQLEEQLMISDEMTKEPVNENEKVHQLEMKLAAQVKMTSQFESEVEELKRKQEEYIFLLTEKDLQLQGKDEQMVSASKENEENTVDACDYKLQLQQVEKLKENVKRLEMQSCEMKNEYESKLNEKESSIFSLEESLMELENKASSLSSVIDGKASFINNLEHKIGEKTADLAEHSAREDQLQLEVKDLMNQVQAKNTEIASMSSKGETLQNETLELKASLEVQELSNKQLRESNSKLEEEIIIASKNSGDSALQFTHLNEQLQIKNEEIDLLNTEIASISSTSKTLQNETLELKASLEVQETSNKKLRESNSKLEEEIIIASKNSGDSALQFTHLNEQLQIKNKEIDLLNTEIASISSTSKTLQNETLELKASLEVQEASNKQLRESSSKLEEEIIIASKNSGDSALQFTHLNEQLQIKNKEIDLLKDRESTLMAENNKLLQQLEDYKVSAQSTQKEVHKLNTTMESLRLENTELTTSYNTLTQTKDSICERLATLETDNKSLTERVVCIKTEKDELLQEKNNTSNIHENIKEKNDQIYKEKETLEQNIINLQKEKKELENKNKSVTDELKASLSTARRYEEEKAMAKKEITESSKAMDQMHDELLLVRTEMEELQLNFSKIEEENIALNKTKDDEANRRQCLEDKVESFNKKEVEMAAGNARVQELLKQNIERESSNRLTKETECANLQVQIKEFISRITVLENNNSLLQFELDELQQKNAVLMSGQNKLSKKSTASTEHEELMEEVENLKFVNIEKEKEVEFLNSIIVDLQKKNKEQKDKIDILSYGDDIHELNGNGNLNETMSPIKTTMNIRMFCDICDLFDLHDTEDCPQQSNDFGGSQHHGKRGDERPYCIICETFGHTADACDEEEMF